MSTYERSRQLSTRRFRAFDLPVVRYRFGTGTSADKFRGLNEFGPYGHPHVDRPTFGFVFPRECRDHANKLYSALKNGIGYFKGFQTAFRMPLTRSQVMLVSDFSIDGLGSPREEARRYTDAIIQWTTQSDQKPDLFFVLH